MKAVNECLQAVARAELSATEQLDKQRAAELEKTIRPNEAGSSHSVRITRFS